MIVRKQTKVVKVGDVFIGGDHPIVIQSMTNTDTSDVKATVDQIHQLQEAGCEIVRVSVPNMASAEAIKAIKKQIHIPLVADIHFDYKLALECLENGIDKLRINPGNIGSEDKVKQIVIKARERKVPIRIGVNAGSLEKEILKTYKGVCAEGLVESAMKHIKILEQFQFEDIVIALKASNIQISLKAYELIAQRVDYPLHVGITEAGTVWSGGIKSAVGIGSILSRGLGDTIRVSLTGDPVEEVRCAKQILQSLGLRQFGIDIISCPTCARTGIDLITLTHQIEKRCARIHKNIKVAIMGCVVNGPGEAREADIGVAAGKGVGVLFKKGKVFKKVREDQILEALLGEIESIG